MSLFDDFTRFLETRLEEFLRNNPHLEIQALQEQLREQAQDTQKLIQSLENEKNRREKEIFELGKEIQRWHQRIEKAQSVGRYDLAQAAQEREAAMLREGNQLWGQMQGARQRLVQARQLLEQIQQRQQEVALKAEQLKAEQAKAQSATDWDTIGWNQGSTYRSRSADPLESEFEKLELNDELERLKRNL